MNLSQNGPTTQPVRWRWGILPAILLLGLSGLLFWGSAFERGGWIEVSEPVESSANHHTYRAPLHSSDSLFRGNDLFRVSSLTLENTTAPILSQSHDADVIKGQLNFTTSQKLATGTKLPVIYQLNWRPDKILPALAIAITAMALFFLVYSGPMDLTGKNGWLERRSVRIGAIVSMLSVLSVFVWANVSNPGWAYGDNHQFLTTTVQGQFLPPMVYPHIGRFFPLGLLEMNCLIPFGNNPLVYHIERALLLCLATGAFYFLMTRITSHFTSCLLVILFLLTPELFRVFSESIFAEALLITCLGFFLLFYHRTQKSNRIADALIAGGFAIAATYCKEPVFGLLLIFALVQLIFGYRTLGKTARSLNFLLVINAMIFFSIYWWVCSTGQSYADIRNAGTGNTTWTILLSKCHRPFFVLSTLVGAYRAYQLILKSDKRLIFSDGVLFAGLGYFGAYMLLKLDADYYLVPAYACWAVAFAGYLELLSQRVQQATSNAIRLNRVRQFSVALGVLAICIVLRISTTQNCIEQVVEARTDSVELSHLFANLKQRGFEMAIYYPPNVDGHEKEVQDWRRTVLNVFDSTQEHNVEPPSTFRNGPFQSVDFDKLTGNQQKAVVVCQPKYVEPLRKDHTALGSYQQVTSIPEVMGAWLLTQSDCMEEVERIAAETRRYR